MTGGFRTSSSFSFGRRFAFHSPFRASAVAYRRSVEQKEDGRHNGVFLGLATIACAFARNYEELLLARAFTGIGEAGYAPAAIAIIAASFPRERRAIAVGIWTLSRLSGGARFSDRRLCRPALRMAACVRLVGIPGIVLAVLYWFTRDYRTIPLEAVAAE